MGHAGKHDTRTAVLETCVSRHHEGASCNLSDITELWYLEVLSIRPRDVRLSDSPMWFVSSRGNEKSQHDEKSISKMYLFYKHK